MSTTKTTPVRTDSGDRINSEDVFEQLVLEQTTICQRCFRRRYREFVEASAPIEKNDRDDILAIDERDGEYISTERNLETTEVVYPPTEKRSTEVAVACECGDVDGAEWSTVPKSRLVEFARRVSERLEEADVAHDRDALLAVVRRGKSRPDLAGRDYDLLGRGVELAVDRGRRSARPEVR